MAAIKRIFVEKKSGCDVEAQSLLREVKDNLRITGLTGLRVLNRYDLEGISGEEYDYVKKNVFSESPVDITYDEEIFIDPSDFSFAVKYLPGQYDQRSDSAEQCIRIITGGDSSVIVDSARLYICSGSLSEDEKNSIVGFCVNPVDSMEASFEKPESLDMRTSVPEDIAVLHGFIDSDVTGIESIANGLAMSADDLRFCQKYFREQEKRNPTATELWMIDTYWSDHCRHTTFLTTIEKIDISDKNVPVKKAFELYMKERSELYGDTPKDICLMDIATIGMKAAKKQGLLDDLDVSEEINACSINVDVDVDGKNQEWLVMFKNETHNHPTEIEPFGGAATCLGGAIRDPLSGRSYVYHAMRVTGSGDPRVPISETLPGKLPQRAIVRGAARGFSAYGNQIGLATGQVTEIYDEG